ncbi:Gfo/Idh/MocA family oxidoreductase [Vibrio sp. Isolate23]|uniref:Gfo/Idh/MocA family oxidoreductase n=1 Tax=Vibrio sp. Isolate23 TaxID=2908533 RepID=UPI001EFDDFE0|nr:Gfo/Idh/MocA family oxidoreductase [Vibrio sp. Isolate23]MCG9683937.1 Gfo/Idh/MocA family oxidoreductase [Vibrio sp. Isolate23]
MMKVLICGFGHAGRAYAQAINSIDSSCQVYIYDLDTNLAIPSWAKKIKDLSSICFDIGIVATPPNSHLRVLEKIIFQCKKIIVEKPIATDKEEYNKIISLANNYKIFFSLHAYFGKEMLLLPNLDGFKLKQNFSISHFFSDPYSNEKENLGGPFWDSIYNVISVFHKVTGGDFTLENCEVSNNNHQCFSAKCEYSNSFGKEIVQFVNVHWDKNLNIKVSQITQDNLCFSLNHSSQSLSTVNGEVNLSVPFEISRLAEHYRSAIHEVLSSSNNTKNLELVESISSVVWAINEEFNK